MRRVILALAASLAIPAGLAVALPTGAAYAAPTIVTCTKLAGSLATGVNATGCNQPKITAGSGKITSNSTGTTFSIKWHTNLTSTGTSVITMQPVEVPEDIPGRDQGRRHG